jgi:glyoxylase-like metal-dependent hydrolase (beta-lactamase superfamily II)
VGADVLPGAVELASGLWYWSEHHPEWHKDVGCVALDTPGSLVLVDPLAPPGGSDARRRFWTALDEQAAGRALDVIVTLHYHRRSAGAVLERYGNRGGATLWAPVGSLARLHLDADRPFEPGDRLPAAIVAYASGREDEAVLWLPGQRAVVSGDVLLGGVRKPFRICPRSWLPDGVTRADVARALQPLLELPVELLVPTHGPVVTAGARAALEAALAEPLS